MMENMCAKDKLLWENTENAGSEKCDSVCAFGLGPCGGDPWVLSLSPAEPKLFDLSFNRHIGLIY